MPDIDKAFRQHQEKQRKYNIQRSPAEWWSVECGGLIVPPFMTRYRQLWWKHPQLLLNTRWKTSGVKWIPLKIPRLWCLQREQIPSWSDFLAFHYKQILQLPHGRAVVVLCLCRVLLSELLLYLNSCVQQQPQVGGSRWEAQSSSGEFLNL